MMSMKLHAAALLGMAALLMPHAGQAQSTPLQPGGSVNLAIPAQSFTNDVYVDIPAGAERITINASAADGSSDIDLLARFESMFPSATLDGRPPEPTWLNDHAQYVAVSPLASESITISRASRQPIRAGRLYLSLINYAGTTAQTTISATVGAQSDFVPITIVTNDASNGSSSEACNISGFSDNAARSPVRGNTGTTLGQQRQLAVSEAARLLAEQLKPAAPIRVQACWASLEFTSNGGTLAQAGPTGLFISDTFSASDGGLQPQLTFVKHRQTIYSKAAIAHQAGTRSCGVFSDACTGYDVRITFNLAPDQSSQTNRRFDYGFTSEGSASSSFISTAMHEIAHGLGFVGLVDLSEEGAPIGSKLSSYDDVYGRWVRISNINEQFLRATTEQRAAALVGFGQARFSGPNAIVSPENPLLNFSPPEVYIALHTPLQIAPGSTYSHISTAAPNQMMNAAISSTAPRSLGLAKDMMYDLGYDPNPASIPAPVVKEGQYFDPLHNGHGFDFRRVAGTTDLYFMVYYSFDSGGNPEWFTTLGRVVDGQYLPARNQFGDSLARNLFRPGQTPQTVEDSSAGFNGQVRIDFDAAAINAPSCQLSPELRPSSGLNRLTLLFNDETTTRWCSQPLLDGRAGVVTDFSGIWFNPADPGWGITFLSFPGTGGDGLAAQIYYPDASGRGRWAIFQTANYVPGAEIPVMQVSNGYCRSCPAPAQLAFTQIGTVKLNLSAANGGVNSTVTLDVTYPGTEGGRFTRTNAPISPGSAPEF